MKKIVLILGVALSVLACNKKETDSNEFKTAYINTGVVISNPEIELEEYKELRSKIKNIMDERSSRGIPPEKVAVKIMEIISASRPKFRYKVD